MKPPYTISPTVLGLLTNVSEKIGQITASHLEQPRAELRKQNRIRTIQASLEIEGNTLNLEQVTAILENKRVIAPPKDIREVQNAIQVYDRLEQLKPGSLTSFLKAHALLMKGLIVSAGKFRSGTVGIAKGSKIAHLAPPADRIKGLLNNLFAYVKKDKDPLLIRSCVFHYELEFIHPFEDGNGRMGRLWQTVLLSNKYSLFAFLPIESIIKKHQKDYYRALALSDKSGNATLFIEFMLGVIDEALGELLLVQRKALTAEERIELFKKEQEGNTFTRANYLAKFKEISSPTASRDLKQAVENKLLIKKGDKRTTKYRFK
ncbi:MAG: Fic family protein [Bacteroidota bacterium]